MTITNCEIELKGLRFNAFHGVLEQEHKVGGDYTVDLQLRLSDAEAAIFDDKLDGTVNYAEVYDLVHHEMTVPSALLEHVAGRILAAIFDRFPKVAAATIHLRKVNPPMGAACDGCAVVLTAER